MNLNIKSCQFKHGFDSSLKLIKSGFGLSSNKQTKKDLRKGNKLAIFNIITLCLSCVDVISAILFYFRKNKEQEIYDEKSIDL